ncbi:hypothetical protein H9P43_004501 [Blastocladiella emersonii ATCC 22665]|nr:hypothetical protein H9P43_004501 [Blastocladiella emersonii ATCC 22665]
MATTNASWTAATSPSSSFSLPSNSSSATTSGSLPPSTLAGNNNTNATNASTNPLDDGAAWNASSPAAPAVNVTLPSTSLNTNTTDSSPPLVKQGIATIMNAASSATPSASSTSAATTWEATPWFLASKPTPPPTSSSSTSPSTTTTTATAAIARTFPNAVTVFDPSSTSPATTTPADSSASAHTVSLGLMLGILLPIAALLGVLAAVLVHTRRKLHRRRRGRQGSSAAASSLGGIDEELATAYVAAHHTHPALVPSASSHHLHHHRVHPGGFASPHTTPAASRRGSHVPSLEFQRRAVPLAGAEVPVAAGAEAEDGDDDDEAPAAIRVLHTPPRPRSMRSLSLVDAAAGESSPAVAGIAPSPSFVMQLDHAQCDQLAEYVTLPAAAEAVAVVATAPTVPAKDARPRPRSSTASGPATPAADARPRSRSATSTAAPAPPAGAAAPASRPTAPASRSANRASVPASPRRGPRRSHIIPPASGLPGSRLGTTPRRPSSLSLSVISRSDLEWEDEEDE